MATNFSSLRSSRKNALDKLNEEIKKESQKQGADPRFWKLSVDAKTKIGYARLRFLPAPKNEDVPWVRVWSHGFDMNGSWFIENCPTTLGGERTCPVCKENNKLWNSGIDADKEVARKRKRKLQFISNVIVVEDSAHPENNGKVFLFKYGAKIHEKIQELMNPQFPDQEKTNPFDMWEGADFKLKSSLVKNYQNYDKSEFADPEPIPGTEDELEKLWESEYSLGAFIADDQFKSFVDLEKRFQKVVYGNSDAPATAVDAIRNEQPTAADAQDVSEQVTKATAEPKGRAPRKPKPPVVETDDDTPEDPDDIKNFFSGVLND